jgi:hypothetical protein
MKKLGSPKNWFANNFFLFLLGNSATKNLKKKLCELLYIFLCCFDLLCQSLLFLFHIFSVLIGTCDAVRLLFDDLNGIKQIEAATANNGEKIGKRP